MGHFDAAVIGAGPAGSTTALCLARAKLDVLLIERAKIPGQKNVFGGRIYSYPLHDLLPNWRKDCPVERYVSRDVFALMTEDQCLQIQFESPKLVSEKATSFTALRPKFDSWLVRKAEDAGVMSITGSRVDDLLIENGRVKGIIAGGDRIEADVVVGADGVVSKFTQRAGLRTEMNARSVSVGVKETVELPANLIQDRFNLDETNGAAYVFAGDASGNLRGGGFLYTNKESISLGLVVSAEDLSSQKIEIHSLQERFKRHPTVARMLQGGKVIEYSTHMIPEIGINTLIRAYTDGFLAVGDAAGFLINNGYTFRGVDLAIASGMAAADTIISAKENGDYSTVALSKYERNLKQSNVLTDLVTFRKGPRFMSNPRLYSLYPKVACELFKKVYMIDGTGQRRIIDTSLEQIKKMDISLIKIIHDLISGARSM